jgi:hypothetical protein
VSVIVPITMPIEFAVFFIFLLFCLFTYCTDFLVTEVVVQRMMQSKQVEGDGLAGLMETRSPTQGADEEAYADLPPTGEESSSENLAAEVLELMILLFFQLQLISRTRSSVFPFVSFGSFSINHQIDIIPLLLIMLVGI